MKIVWHSNAPWAPTGYGQQTALFTPRIRDIGHDVAISAMWGLGGAQLDWHGMRVYPSDDKWGNRTLPAIADHHAAGDRVLVLTLMDVWVLSHPKFADMHMTAWCPVDHAPLPPRVGDFFDRTAATPIAMSRFGERMLTDYGLQPLYVPHGVDTTIFQPREDRAAMRRIIGVPDDAFVVGMVAANKGHTPPRKAFPQVMLAFSELLRHDPDAYLYLHTELAGTYDGVNLGALAKACGIPTERVKYTAPTAMELGIDPEALSHLYSAFDVLAHPSYGEGFGVPIIEAQACGTPVILTDCTAMTELCGAGWLVDGDPWYDTTQGAFFTCPSVEQILHAMLAARDMAGDQQLRARAREFALGYDADRVFAEHWVPVLEQLALAAAAAPAAEVRRPNRAQRRASARAGRAA